MTYEITFINGDTETIECDRFVSYPPSHDRMVAELERTYGPNEQVAVFPMANIRKYRKLP